MSADLDKFFKDLSDLSKQDIIQAYADAIKTNLLASGVYFVDEPSKTLLGVVETGGAYWCVRLEGKGHHCTVGLIKRIRKTLQGLSKRRPVFVRTHKRFFNKKAKKLLKLTGFIYFEERDGYIISKYGGV